eukprot:CAMPEP_0197854996 /NCGR_PEP_ID=MMETSP1438-20131217/25755_1 /TAXON_ID=1461541 /ORGANISM="Pterosperma sp., Strain CCMP1384" /LENGTH=326 /DNA_ID=CAMNT_0043469951 /DNA_START=14 /DNA_END=994 /DNA_ORIENTATION=-
MGASKRKKSQAAVKEVEEQPTDTPKPKKTKNVSRDVGAGAGPSGRDQSSEEKKFVNKEKVLILASRGITHRYRHLMTDMMTLLPHNKKEPKLDTKDDRQLINEVAELKGCTSAMFFEVRKHKDLYLWMSKIPSGPSVKFHVVNVHTMDELKLTGNHLLGSRPVLSFDKQFDELPHLQVLKELLSQIFGVPKNHRKVKPFFDHVITFSLADNRIWFRNYQCVYPDGRQGKQAVENMTLAEVGPRMCLNPIRIFAGSFRGVTLYDNPAYVSPNYLRAQAKREASSKYDVKVKKKSKRDAWAKEHKLEPGELDDVFEGVDEEFSDSDSD